MGENKLFAKRKTALKKENRGGVEGKRQINTGVYAYF